MAKRFLNKTTLAIAIVAAGAIIAVLAVASFAQARANTYGPGFWMHGGPAGYFGGGPYGHAGGMMYDGTEGNRWTLRGSDRGRDMGMPGECGASSISSSK